MTSFTLPPKHRRSVTVYVPRFYAKVNINIDNTPTRKQTWSWIY